MAKTVLEQYYQDEVVDRFQKEFGCDNVMRVPRIEKVVLNSGVGTRHEREALDEAGDTLAVITGQKPVVKRAKKSVSNFKLRAGMPIGVSVTLRRQMMWNFLNRFINIVLPRVRDFRGVSPNGFDGSGNYNMGLNDQSVFTEINLDKVKNTIGMNISIVTTAESDEQGRKLLQTLGMPFAEQ